MRGTAPALWAGMTFIKQTAPSTSKLLPKHGPAYTFYLYTLLAVGVAIATYVGLRIAAVPHWF